ncbi:hypothetical protein AVEN_54121-1 [Araneus ventricosus]|uniref:Uncharacterized protein n=1 Tax=Araneus ventricosus TaxID=182803 RepID=A0A4Y2BTX4_ARAVE|nr:hypothetical protein AVEN_54121-1 [Araneus ventricosus]
MLLETLNQGQTTRTIPELAILPPNFYNTPRNLTLKGFTADLWSSRVLSHLILKSSLTPCHRCLCLEKRVPPFLKETMNLRKLPLYFLSSAEISGYES